MAPTLGPDFAAEPVLVGEIALDLVVVPVPVGVVEARVATGEDSAPPDSLQCTARWIDGNNDNLPAASARLTLNVSEVYRYKAYDFRGTLVKNQLLT
jgi:hypothetical protein